MTFGSSESNATSMGSSEAVPSSAYSSSSYSSYASVVVVVVVVGVVVRNSGRMEAIVRFGAGVVADVMRGGLRVVVLAVLVLLFAVVVVAVVFGFEHCTLRV